MSGSAIYFYRMNIFGWTLIWTGHPHVNWPVVVRCALTNLLTHVAV